MRVTYGVILSLIAPVLLAQENGPIKLSPQANALHQSSLVFDGHNDLALQFKLRLDKQIEDVDLTKRHPTLRTDIPRLRKGGVKAQFWSANPFDFPKFQLKEPFRFTSDLIDTIHRMIKLYPDTFELALTASDIDRISSSGKIASLIAVEGGNALENSMEKLHTFYQLGVRYLTLTHFANTELADSASDKPIYGGLSKFGQKVVQEMNALGMLIDISHVSRETALEVLELSKAPVIFSHAGAYEVTPTARNVSDDVLLRLRANGGVVMAIFCSRYLRSDKERGTIEDFLDHVDHLVSVAGIDHVGLGSDFEGDLRYPEQLDDVSDFPNITQGLLNRGYTPEAIRKILGENTLRVFRQVAP